MRKLLDIGMGGDVGAIRLSLAYLSPAHAELAGAAQLAMTGLHPSPNERARTWVDALAARAGNASRL
jgi:hypothetical protein